MSADVICIRACQSCARKLGELYDLEEIEGTEQAEKCPWCYRFAPVGQYRDYGKRRPAYSRARSGGGERSRSF